MHAQGFARFYLFTSAASALPLPFPDLPLAMTASASHPAASLDFLYPLCGSPFLPFTSCYFTVLLLCDYIITHFISIVNTFLTIL